MPCGKQHVTQSLGVEVCSCSIEHQRSGRAFSADTQIVGNKQHFGSRVGAGFAEWIRPEDLMARVVQFHSGEKLMSAVEILDHLSKSSVVTIVAIESPVIAALE